MYRARVRLRSRTTARARASYMVRVRAPQGLATTPSSSPFGSSDCSDPVLLPADGPRLRLRKLKPYLYTVGVRVTVLRCWKLNVIVRSIPNRLLSCITEERCNPKPIKFILTPVNLTLLP